MALKGYDGFDHYSAAADFFAKDGFIQYSLPAVSANPTFVSPGRTGDGKYANLSGLVVTFGQRVASAGVGFGTIGGTTWSFVDSIAAQTQVSVQFNSSNYTIVVKRGDGTQLYLSPNNVWGADVWNFIEIWLVVDSSAGSVRVDVNGQTLVNLTGINTQHSSNAWWDQLSVPGLPVNLPFDDLYYCDSTSGAGTYPCNAPLGDMHVFTKFAVGNSSVQWTPLANANWQEVSEVAMDSDTSYNSTTTAGNEDLLNFGALEATISKIIAVQVTGAYRKDDAGSRVIKQALKSGTTEVYGVDFSLPTNQYAYWTDAPWVVDPNTSVSWTLSGVNAVSAGYNLVS